MPPWLASGKMLSFALGRALNSAIEFAVGTMTSASPDDVTGKVVRFLASGDGHDFDGVADYVGGALFAFRAAWHWEPRAKS